MNTAHLHVSNGLAGLYVPNGFYGIDVEYRDTAHLAAIMADLLRNEVDADGAACECDDDEMCSLHAADALIGSYLADERAEFLVLGMAVPTDDAGFYVASIEPASTCEGDCTDEDE